jgi:hypothetical protein
MPLPRVHGNRLQKILWLGSVALALACSSSDDTDFFEPGDDANGGSTGGDAGSSSGSDSGGTSTGGSAGHGGTSGDGSGGSGSEATGGTGDTGGTGAEGGTSAGSGRGGTEPAGGSDQGGDAGSGAAPTGGSAGTPAGGMGGAGTSGTSAGGAGMGGAGMGGAGMGGAGTGGAGTGGAGAGTGGAGTGGAGTGGAAGSGGCVPTVPATERCDGIDNNCTGGVDEGVACPDHCTGATRAGHTYLLCAFENASGAMTRLRTWSQALEFCSMRGFGLVAIESAEEDAFILQWIAEMELEDQVWMGANDRDQPLGPNREGTWVWGSGNAAVQFWQGGENGMSVMMRYEDWATGEPNNTDNEDCGVLSAKHDYQWADRACASTFANFVCESTASITTN